MTGSSWRDRCRDIADTQAFVGPDVLELAKRVRRLAGLDDGLRRDASGQSGRPEKATRTPEQNRTTPGQGAARVENREGGAEVRSKSTISSFHYKGGFCAFGEWP
jgi:hypothetical protein